ncbi:MAG: cytochrome b N-terminal domain-containing protein [Euryarchaeota archaeon]|nr:cytochrome b N-terminal domain-containing protein [Euryarchaeota archaeon]
MAGGGKRFERFEDPLYRRGLFHDLGFRIAVWLDRRLRLGVLLEKGEYLYNTINRQLPRTHTEKYKLRSVWLWYPFYALGGISIVCFLLLAVTGILLAFYYIPSTEGDPPIAYQSMLHIMTQVPFGYILRGVHRWAAQIMVAAVFLHMCRVYFTGAYRKPREVNWILGVGLLAMTLFFAYSGYLLPWDELAFWAGQIGLEMATAVPTLGAFMAQLMWGGTSLGPDTLIRMYVFHVILLPIVVGVLIFIHSLLVWWQGLAEPH